MSGFGSGLYHGVADPVSMAVGLVNPFDDPLKHWQQLGSGVWFGVTHPGAFGKALVDWQDLSHGDVGRWLGQLAPTVAATFFTAGGAAGLRGADTLAAADRVAESADALEVAGNARFIAGADGLVDTGIEVPHGMPVVIGEDMADRVTPAAAAMVLEDYSPPQLDTFAQQMAHNRYWINEMMNEGRPIVDVGPAPFRPNFPEPSSPFYQMERDEMLQRGYQWYTQVDIGH